MINPQARGRALDTHNPASYRFAPVDLTVALTAREELDYWHPAARKLRLLSPAASRMLGAVRLALMTKSDPAKGYSFRPFVNRGQIARQLERSGGLVPYDVVLLGELVDDGLIMMDKRALPAKTVIRGGGQAHQLGAGWEYIYAINRYILAGLLKEGDPDAFKHLQEGTNRTREIEPSEVGQPGAVREAQSFYERYDRMSPYDLAKQHQGHDFETETHTYTWTGDRHFRREKPRGVIATIKDLLGLI